MDFQTLAKEQPAASGAYVGFDMVGQRIEGKIASVRVVPATKFQTNELDTFPDGTQKYNVVVAVHTNLRDDPDDDGLRSIWTKWFGAQRGAWAQALAETKSEGPEEGGYFAATYTGDLKGDKGLSPTKLFRFEYRPPATGMAHLAQQQPVNQVVNVAGAAPYGSVPTAQPPAPAQPAAQPQLPVQPAAQPQLPVQPAVQPQQLQPQQPVAQQDLAATFAQIKAAIGAGLTVEQVTLMMPTVDPAAIRAVAAAPAA